MILFFVSSIPTLPFSIYQTFVLEEKHGFNKTTPGLFVADLLKGWALGFVLGAPFLAAFLYIFKWAGDRFVPWLMGFLSVASELTCPHFSDQSRRHTGSFFNFPWLSFIPLSYSHCSTSFHHWQKGICEPELKIWPQSSNSRSSTCMKLMDPNGVRTAMLISSVFPG
jgi:CAAX prenyl protease N-terminal, five membrane helices